MLESRPQPDWEQYPLNLPRSIHRHVDLNACYERLVRKSSQLFSGQGEIEVWQHDHSNPVIPIQFNLNTEYIDTTRDSMYFINQLSSWSPLQTSMEAVQKLLTAHSISPIFLDALYSFEAKVTGDDDPYFNLCDKQVLHSTSELNDQSYETCYILRSYEKHGRATLKDPWSLRQAAIYHKYDSQTGRSIWIFIQLFQRCKTALWNEFARPGYSTQTMDVHALVLGMMLPDWRWYLNDRRHLINQYLEKARYSSLAPKPNDFEIDFVDCQRLQKLIDSLYLSQEILKSIKRIASVIQSAHGDPRSIEPDHRSKLSTHVPVYVDRIEGFLSAAAALAKRAESISVLLSKLLHYRKADLLNHQTVALARIIAETNVQSDRLRKLAEESRSDTRSMKTLTFVAMIYMPANLIAAIFSTNLIQLPRTSVASDQAILSVQPAIGIYVLSSVLLTTITVMGAFLWVRHSKGCLANLGISGKMVADAI